MVLKYLDYLVEEIPEGEKLVIINIQLFLTTYNYCLGFLILNISLVIFLITSGKVAVATFRSVVAVPVELTTLLLIYSFEGNCKHDEKWKNETEILVAIVLVKVLKHLNEYIPTNNVVDKYCKIK